jgi:hypothetical protein
MLENEVYNLMNQLVQEHKSLWRIKNHYQSEADGCEECLAFWKKMEEDKASHIEELKSLVSKHI